MSTFMDEIRSQQKQYGGGNTYFSFDEKGIYRIRILNSPKISATHFFGKGNPSVVCIGIEKNCPFHKETDKKPSLKLCSYIIDRADGKVKMAELPLSLSYAINDLQQDSDFAFEDFPMPYDVKITYDPDNDDPKSKYRLVASPERKKLSMDEEAMFSEAMKKQTPEQYVETKKARQEVKNGSEKSYEYPENTGEPKF